MKSALQSLAVTLALVAAACAPAENRDSLPRDADALLEALHASGNFSGAVIIGRDGAVAYEGAFGRADRTRPFTLDTAADGASLAKTVTAAVIWRLVADGAVTLDDPVQKYVAEFPYPAVTIRHLLSHTAAVPDYDAFMPVLESGQAVSNLGLQALMRRSSPVPLREPGATYRYCNICYDTLALLVERVTGESYAKHAVQDYLGALGARRAFLRPTRFADWPEPRTIGFRSAVDGADIYDVFDNEALYGGSNIYFTARDLHAWARAWIEGRALPPAVVDEALAPARIGNHSSAISLTSWYCAPARDRCYYTGHHQGFFNFVYWDRTRDLSVAFVSNNTLPGPLQPWLMRALVALAQGEKAAPPPSLPPKTLNADIAATAGRYVVPGVGAVEIFAAADGARVRIDGGPDYQLYQIGYGVLYAPGLDAYLSLAPPSEGNAGRMKFESVFTSAQAAKS